MTDTETFTALADRYWSWRKHEAPFGAFIAGQLGDEVILFRESLADYSRREADVRAMLAEAEAIDIAKLEGEDRVSLQLLLRELRDSRDSFEVHAHLRPALLPVGPDFNTAFYANSVTIVDAASAELHIERMKHFPAFLADVRECLAEGHARGIRYPRIILEASSAATRGIASTTAEASPWYGPFQRSSVKDRPEVARLAEQALDLISKEIIPSLQAHADFVAGPLSEGARETLSCRDAPDGDRFYDLMVRHFTTTDMTPAQVHELGLSEVARIEAAMVETAKEAGFDGDVDRYRRFLLEDPQFISPDAETLLERIEILCKRIDAKIPAFFRRIPRITYGVSMIPAAASKSLPAAYAMPASPGGTTAGMFFVNGLPERCPSYIHPCLVVHEAWPGHLMHIGMMAELDHQPAFRRYNATAYTACVEGWALYCEQLGQEFGVYTSPHHHFGRLDMEMWRACRLVVDTGIHLHGWSREQGIEYMAARMTLDRGSIAAEVDRYAALPGQALGYQIGGLKFRELRKRAEATLGARFDLRAYHEAVMTAGAVTLPILEEIVDLWIASVASEKAAA